MPGAATIYLMVGLPGAGKTTMARRIAAATAAVRLTPDEWMAPLFGHNDADGKRDVLEGRMIAVAREVAAAGGSAILDFGCWSPEERYAIRAIAEGAGAAFALHFDDVPEQERRRRADERWATVPHETFEMTEADHEAYLRVWRPPMADELAYGPIPAPPEPFATWGAWAADRWPGLAVLPTV